MGSSCCNYSFRHRTRNSNMRRSAISVFDQVPFFSWILPASRLNSIDLWMFLWVLLLLQEQTIRNLWRMARGRSVYLHWHKRMETRMIKNTTKPTTMATSTPLHLKNRLILLRRLGRDWVLPSVQKLSQTIVFWRPEGEWAPVCFALQSPSTFNFRWKESP